MTKNKRFKIRELEDRSQFYLGDRFQILENIDNHADFMFSKVIGTVLTPYDVVNKLNNLWDENEQLKQENGKLKKELKVYHNVARCW